MVLQLRVMEFSGACHRFLAMVPGEPIELQRIIRHSGSTETGARADHEQLWARELLQPLAGHFGLSTVDGTQLLGPTDANRSHLIFFSWHLESHQLSERLVVEKLKDSNCVAMDYTYFVMFPGRADMQ